VTSVGRWNDLEQERCFHGVICDDCDVPACSYLLLLLAACVKGKVKGKVRLFTVSPIISRWLLLFVYRWQNWRSCRKQRQWSTHVRVYYFHLPPLLHSFSRLSVYFCICPLAELTARVNGPSWWVAGFHYPSTRTLSRIVKQHVKNTCVPFRNTIRTLELWSQSA